MNTLRRVSSAVALAAASAACTAPVTRVEPAVRAPAVEASPAATTATPARTMRYYRDETGAYWDDRGRKLAPDEQPVTATVP